jgi:phosphoesterase RecJ-like protein
VTDGFPFELPAGVERFLTSHDSYLLLGHQDPDGDCLASPLALAGFLRRRGKRARTFCEGPFTRPEIAAFAPRFATQVTPEDRAGDAAAIVMDCSTADRTGEPGKGIQGLPTLVIDHHAAGEPFGDERLIVPAVPATALIVQGLIELLGDRPTREEAELLLFATCTDTGFFRHLRKDTGYVFRAVARLVDAGASTEAAYRSMFGARPLERRVMLGRMLARTERLYGGLLLYTVKYSSDRAEIGEAGRGDDDLYSLLQTVAGVEALLVVREEGPGECSVSMRSTTAVDVGSCARELGGGGHPQAAGCTFHGSAEQAKEAALAVLAPQMDRLRQQQR